MAERGRPTAYTPEIAAEICERMAAGESLRELDDHRASPCKYLIRFLSLEYPAFLRVSDASAFSTHNFAYTYRPEKRL